MNAAEWLPGDQRFVAALYAAACTSVGQGSYPTPAEALADWCQRSAKVRKLVTGR